MQAGVEVEGVPVKVQKSQSGICFQADTSLLVGYKMIDFESARVR